MYSMQHACDIVQTEHGAPLSLVCLCRGANKADPPTTSPGRKGEKRGEGAGSETVNGTVTRPIPSSVVSGVHEACLVGMPKTRLDAKHGASLLPSTPD